MLKMPSICTPFLRKIKKQISSSKHIRLIWLSIITIVMRKELPLLHATGGTRAFQSSLSGSVRSCFDKIKLTYIYIGLRFYKGIIICSGQCKLTYLIMLNAELL